MKGRKNDSKLSTSLPSDYLVNLSETIKNQYPKYLADAQVITQGRVFDSEVLLRVGLLQNGRIKQHNFEISFDLPNEKDKVLPRLDTAVDFVGGLIAEFVAKNGFEEIEFEESLPVLWRPVDLAKDRYFFQYSTENSALEDLANQWLSKVSDVMVQESDLSDDAYNYSEQYDAETLEVIIEERKKLDPESVEKSHLH